MAYPSSIDSFTTKTSTDYVLAAHVNSLQTAVVAIETELGTDPAGTETNVADRLDALEATASLLAGRKRRFNILTVKGDPDNPPVDSMLDGTLVSTPIMLFSSSVDQKVHFSFHVPPDCNTDYDLTLCLDCAVNDDGDTGETVGIELHYACVANDESITGATEHTVDITDGLDVSSWDAEKRYYVDDLVIDAAHIAAGDTIHCTLQRDTDDDDDYPHDFGIYNIAIEYTIKNPST